jgi:hypothetical protein
VRKTVPLTICFVFGMFMLTQFFVPHRRIQDVSQVLLEWDLVVWTFALFLSGINLFLVNAGKVRRKERDWGYKIVLLLAFLGTLVSGLAWGVRTGTPFMFIYESMMKPLQATMFALLAFFISSAAYRAFRARTREAALLLAAGLIVMLGRIPIGDMIWHRIPVITDWIMSYPNMAAQRGILMGASLGAIATALRMLVGLERGYFGGES